MTREESARKFAAAMGWTVHVTPFAIYFTFLNDSKVPKVVTLPDEEDGLAEHFEFVGKIADTLECYYPEITTSDTQIERWRVEFFLEEENVGEATDPAWAAMDAATAAKESGE